MRHIFLRKIATFIVNCSAIVDIRLLCLQTIDGGTRIDDRCWYQIAIHTRLLALFGVLIFLTCHYWPKDWPDICPTNRPEHHCHGHATHHLIGIDIDNMTHHPDTLLQIDEGYYVRRLKIG